MFCAQEIAARAEKRDKIDDDESPSGKDCESMVVNATIKEVIKVTHPKLEKKHGIGLTQQSSDGTSEDDIMSIVRRRKKRNVADSHTSPTTPVCSVEDKMMECVTEEVNRFFQKSFNWHSILEEQLKEQIDQITLNPRFGPNKHLKCRLDTDSEEHEVAQKKKASQCTAENWGGSSIRMCTGMATHVQMCHCKCEHKRMML